MSDSVRNAMRRAYSLGRRYLSGAKGDVALPRTVNKMAGVYVPPQWPQVIR